MKRENNRIGQRQSRHARIRRRIAGTAERPRMAIMISNRHIYVQFVDDQKQATLASATTRSEDGKGNATVAKAQELGRSAAAAAIAAGIQRVVVDRGGFKFHGRVKALVDGAVAAGLQIRTKPVEPDAVAEATDAGADKEES